MLLYCTAAGVSWHNAANSKLPGLLNHSHSVGTGLEPAGYQLPRLQLLDRCHLIAKLRGLLILFGLGRCIHLLSQPVNHSIIAAFQEQHRTLHVVGIIFGADLASAWAGATLNLKLQAWAAAIGKEGIFALPDAEDFLNQ